MKSQLISFALLLGLFSMNACKNEGGSTAAQADSSRWKEVSYANALEAAHSAENKEGWVTNQLVPSGTNIHAALNVQDSLTIMQYRIVQNSEIGILVKYLEGAKGEAKDFIEALHKSVPGYDWWPVDKIADQAKDGKLVIARIYNNNTRETTFQAVNPTDGEYYYWRQIYTLRPETPVNNEVSDSAAAPAADTTPAAH